MGASLARSLAAEGAEVTVLGRRSPETPPFPPEVSLRELDFMLQENRDKVLELARKADILCYLWGPFLQKPLDETGAQEWDFMAFANLAFPGSLVSAALPSMRAAGWGRILLFGGTRTDEVRGFFTNPAYGAVKTGLSSLAKSVALSYAREGITCNVLCPGFVESGRHDAQTAAALAEKMPDGLLIREEEVAEAAVFLLRGALFNGISLRIDKGWEPKFI